MRERTGSIREQRAGERENQVSERATRSRKQESRIAGEQKRKCKISLFQTDINEEKARYKEKRLFTHPLKLHFTQARFSSYIA